MNPLDLSFRIKLPLWGAVLVILTALAVSTSDLLQANEEMKEDQALEAEVLGKCLVAIIHPLMVHDNVWRVYETLRQALEDTRHGGHARAEAILVVNRQLRVFAASDPQQAPLLSDFRQLGADYTWVGDQIAGLPPGKKSTGLAPPNSAFIFFVTPVVQDQASVGWLVLVSNRQAYLPRFFAMVLQALLIGLLIVAILLPFNWFWGRRMARPLVELTDQMSRIGKSLPAPLDPQLYSHRDELGQLFAAYNSMLNELHGKAELERQMVQTERLSALGQLAAGVAHEINNPLGGMLTAIDTLKCHSDMSTGMAKTVALLERGLLQIKDTVGALLIEAKVKSRDLEPQDVEDIRTLIAVPVRKKNLTIEWHNRLSSEIRLPASLIRQILINLTLNAIQAAASHGQVAMTIAAAGGRLELEVSNDGKTLNEDEISHLFEPFSTLSENGHGLGLWVTYQIVRQLGGSIHAKRQDERMKFSVCIPCQDPE